jgi:hypothetical protein
MSEYSYHESEFCEGWEITKDGELWFSVPCEEDAQQVCKALSNDYMYKDLKDFEDCVGCEVNKAFKIGWDMARMPLSALSRD